MTPLFFSSPEAFRTWLDKHHKTEKEVWVGYHKKHTGKPSMTWSESVDQALCYGWIDGIRKSIDSDRYMNRFTPRRPTSIWSTVNINKVTELTKQGLMMPLGIEAFNKRKEERSSIYSFEQKESNPELPREYLAQLKSNKKAWKHWRDRPPHFKKTAIWHIVAAKQENTKAKRLQQLISDCEQFPTLKDLRLHYTKRWV